MSNTRRFNARFNVKSRPSKRQRMGTYHDHALFEDDFEVIHHRESGLDIRNHVVETPRSPQKGRTALPEGDSWEPMDDVKIGLDPGSEWFDIQVEVDIISEFQSPEKKKRKRSKVSVSFSIQAFRPFLISIAEAAPYLLEEPASKVVPG